MKIRNWIFWLVIMWSCQNNSEKEGINPNEGLPGEDTTIVASLDSLTGLVVAPHFELVKSQCTSCHSAKLITQNRATREGWQQMITWMQASQGLWDLGDSEVLILDYLSQHYSPAKQGRRAPLTDIEWYELKD